MEEIGNVYDVQMVEGDGCLFSQESFIAINAKEAIEKAGTWIKKEYPKHAETVVVGDVKRIARDVIL